MVLAEVALAVALALFFFLARIRIKIVLFLSKIVVPDLEGRTGGHTSFAMEQGINLAGEVFCVFVGNELVSFHPEPTAFVIAVILETAADRVVCFGVSVSVDPMGPS